MAGGSGGRNLEETPTWAVSAVCFVLILISITIEHIIHLIGKWLKKKHRRALYESLEKIKSELMLLGFISLLLTVGQGPISRICISEKVAGTWHPCDDSSNHESDSEESENRTNSRRLLAAFYGSDDVNPRRVLAGGGADKCPEGPYMHQKNNGKSPVCVIGWHSSTPYIYLRAGCFSCPLLHFHYGPGQSKDPERFRFARETSFGRRHLSFWTKNPVLIWIVCFFRQFVRSVPNVDYLTLRHGFIMIILLVGTKLQVIITEMGLKIQQRGEVLKGVPLVQPGDHLFWFNRPGLILYLINFVLFQNAFQLAFFAWSALQFGIKSCFHSHTEDVVIRITMGVLIQILCSYVTLPLYALVTQMGSTMKPTIFNERVALGLRNWHQTAKKHIRQNRVGPLSLSGTPTSSRPTTPSHNLSPVHLFRYYRSEIDSFPTSPQRSNLDDNNMDSPSPSYSHHELEMGHLSQQQQQQQQQTTTNDNTTTHHEIVVAVHSKEFSFDKRPTSSNT
ncbi:hypothetical protein JHK85_033737 [Glycine max]|nr:hypothetical protein JHK85_033737 [Glycine max]